MMTGEQAASKQIPALEGWFTWPPSEEPHLIGSRCKSCGDYFFPKVIACHNPRCMSEDVEKVLLSRRGKLYTYTINYYQPPPPYIPPDPFVPYADAVVELEKEKMKIQGQVASGCDLEALKVGMEMELVLEPLYNDLEGNEVVAWKFKPV
jgi:hypothetical protein